jgi:hypothetical protein
MASQASVSAVVAGREVAALDPSSDGMAMAVEASYLACVSDSFPRAANAAMRAGACSSALQTRQLRPDQIALARLTRGIARSLLGNRELASDDNLEAIRNYDRLMDPGNSDVLMLCRRATGLNAGGRIDEAARRSGRIPDRPSPISAAPCCRFGLLSFVRNNDPLSNAAAFPSCSPGAAGSAIGPQKRQFCALEGTCNTQALSGCPPA